MLATDCIRPSPPGQSRRFFPTQQSPGDPGQLVGERHDHRVAMASRQQAAQPRPERGLALGQWRQRRSGAVDQEGAQIGVAALADPEQPRLAASGVLARNQAKEGAQIAGVAEVLPGRPRRRAPSRSERRRPVSRSAAGLLRRCVRERRTPHRAHRSADPAPTIPRAYRRATGGSGRAADVRRRRASRRARSRTCDGLGGRSHHARAEAPAAG